EQEPVLLLAVEPGRDERPDALEARAVQPHRQAAVRLLLEELVRAVVPDFDGAGAVVALRDLTGERRVVERMILDAHRERALADLERHTLGDAPRGKRAAALEPEVVVETAGLVALDDEDR